MALDRAELWELRLPLRKAVDWTAGGAEAEVPYLVLVLHDADGRKGATEITCRPAWNGMTPGLLARAFEDLAWPRLAGLGSGGSAAEALAGIRGMGALKALCDNAWRDLCAPMAGGEAVRVATVLTRDEPGAMAEAALAIRDETGIEAFKVKLGQGLDRDAEVLGALRRALPEAELSGDANSAYGLADLADLGALAGEMGLVFLEDPCPLFPDADTAAAVAGLPLPVLADKAVEGPENVPAFADRGILQVSAKPSRIGITAAQAIANMVKARAGRICNGTYSESALGAAAQIGFAQSLPGGLAHPHEVDFHRGLAAQIAPLPEIQDGRALPVMGRVADRLDHGAIRRFGTPGPDLRHKATKGVAR